MTVNYMITQTTECIVIASILDDKTMTVILETGNNKCRIAGNDVFIFLEYFMAFLSGDNVSGEILNLKLDQDNLQKFVRVRVLNALKYVGPCEKVLTLFYHDKARFIAQLQCMVRVLGRLTV